MSDDIDELKRKLQDHETKIKDQNGGNRNILWILFVGALLAAAYFLGYWPIVEKYAKQTWGTLTGAASEVKATLEQGKEILK